MNSLISGAFSRARTMILMLIALLLSGSLAYITIPKESMPEIDIPTFIVNTTYSGVSAQDAAQLLAEPIERKVNSLKGLRRMETKAAEGFASVTLEFRPGFDQDEALQSVKDAVDDASPDLPPGADGPFVREIDMAMFPILTVALSGQVPERELIRLGRQLSDAIETVSGVLQADLTGERDDQLEVLIDPLAMETYGISPGQLAQAVRANNQLIAVGSFDTGAGRLGVSIPGTVVRMDEIMSIPVLVNGPTVLRVQDVAEVRQTFKDPISFARIDGQPALVIDVRKTSGANVIDTVAAVRELVAQRTADWPEQVAVDFMNDQSVEMRDLLSDLQNNVIAAVVLVMLITVLFLGVRASMLVGMAIPGSFLGGILIVWLLGFTLNVVVLFALILVVGMLVDGAMVVVEMAERLIAQGHSRFDAFRQAAQRMAWPITASIATTVAVFFPLLFWPGMAGQFMFYFPATMIATLSMSLIMALIFVPVLGGILGGGADAPPTAPRGSLIDGVAAWTIARPATTLGLSILSLLVVFYAYGQLGRGVDFFPSTDAERAQVQIQADGNLSVHEADRLVQLVEHQLVGLDGIERVYARTIGSVEQRVRANVSSDVIGQIQVEFVDWKLRSRSDALIAQMRTFAEQVPGLTIQVEAAASGPGASRPVQIEVSASDRATLQQASATVERLMLEQGTFVDIGNDTPRPNPEIRLVVDREESARFGVDMDTIGTAVRLLTTGVNLGTYLPDFADDEVDIALRYPPEQRNFENLATMRVNVPIGQVPISNVVQIIPAPAPAAITRVAGRETQTLSADLAPGSTLDAELARISAAIDAADLPDSVTIRFGGEIEDQQEAMTFLMGAFVAAIFLTFMILLLQMNSFYQTFLILTAIIFSIAGVFLGLIIRQEPFSIVMSGIGIMALAGVVVNNNIVLIDAYNEYRGQGDSPDAAALRAASERFRPVMLTALTTVVGLMPMVMGLTVDFVGRDMFLGAPSGQMWIQLATGIAGGLAVATVVTLLLTPTLLAWDGRRRERASARRDERRAKRRLAAQNLPQGAD
ncbi:efflux RND transporter permease subunit [Paracoccus sp. (in: a-proteobacteria)]|uniref:efflux RND transporter permease subunit n=1 Tax=Paracoccus sp. TaxID=267 RepID=UPI0026DEA3C4|nr:efflux RND transporter permease subunit [Paracoccus sp. (in: a-proteobacteria)]MDO5646502.1 efflux RND transporter permease subunit [Paracoccus sp. (in: a-proteobacteria)]